MVVDVGSGTGISSAMFLEAGFAVAGVEPNPPMREAAERLLAKYDRFRSIDGSAAATTLDDACARLIVAAQAFHWFANDDTRAEFSRILRRDGKIAIIWNERLLDADDFHRDYEALLERFGTDYASIRHENTGEQVLTGFFRGSFDCHAFDNAQHFDLAGLEGRLLSSSYTPAPGDPDHQPMLAALHDLFSRHAIGGQVTIRYRTRVYLGR
nr:class I SAM-dependent methyltransferase [Luteolibacter marinus]